MRGLLGEGRRGSTPVSSLFALLGHSQQGSAAAVARRLAGRLVWLSAFLRNGGNPAISTKPRRTASKLFSVKRLLPPRKLFVDGNRALLGRRVRHRGRSALPCRSWRRALGLAGRERAPRSGGTSDRHHPNAGGGSMAVALARSEASLEDRWAAPEGWFYMTGMQALVRLPIQQRLRDIAAGLNTGGYVSGYRGSPLGRFDIELWRADTILKQHNIVFRPGLNEDLAATAIWGAQHLTSFPGATVEGVFGIWYGKGPGVDRSGDVLRHANFTGVSPRGGALALAGDDHGAKSSTAVNFSDTSFVAVGMPVLYPSNTQELIDFGLHGIAMSRFSGCWVGMKVVTDVAEGGGTVYVGPDSPPIVIPERPSKPAGGVSARSIDMPLMQEERLYNHKLPAALAYARANELNRVVGDSPNARVGVVAAGKAWQDLLQALGNLGLSGAALGLRLLKVGMV